MDSDLRMMQSSPLISRGTALVGAIVTAVLALVEAALGIVPEFFTSIPAVFTAVWTGTLVLEERRKRRRHLEIDTLREVVQPAITAIEENENDLAADSTSQEWSRLAKVDVSPLVFRPLAEYADIDSGTAKRFENENCQLWRLMTRYDAQLVRIEQNARTVFTKAREPLQQYIDEQELERLVSGPINVDAVIELYSATLLSRSITIHTTICGNNKATRSAG